MLDELLVEPSAVVRDEVMRDAKMLGYLHMQRGLGVSRNMRNYPLEDLRRIRGRGTKLGVEVLELDLFAPEVVAKTSELAFIVLFTLLVGEAVVLDALPHLRGVLVQQATHGGDRCDRRVGRLGGCEVGNGAKALPCEAISRSPSQNTAVPCICRIKRQKVSCDKRGGDMFM